MEATTVRIAEARQRGRWDFQPFSHATSQVQARLECSPFPVVRLRDIVLGGTIGVAQGFSVAAEASEGIPMITGRHLTGRRITEPLEDIRYLTPEEHAKLAGTQLRRGDVVVNLLLRPGVAAVYDASTPANIGARLVRLRLTGAVDPYYLVEYLNSELGASLMSMLATGSVMPVLTAQALLDLPVILPPLAEQRRISQEALEAQVEAESLNAQAEALRLRAQRGFLETLTDGGAP